MRELMSSHHSAECSPPADDADATPLLAGVERRRVALASGVELALLDFGGDGPLALLHHANGFCAATLVLVAEGLTDRFRVIAMDARGHGASSKPPADTAYAWSVFGTDLAEAAGRIAGELDRPRVALGVGHSFGGTATLAAAAGSPGLFERLVCIDPVILPPARPGSHPPSDSGNRLREGALRRRRSWPSREEARDHLRSRSLFARFEPRALDLYIGFGLEDLPEGGVGLCCPPEVEAAIFAGGDHDLHERVAGLETPTLLLWARRGNFARATYEALAARMPRATVRDLEAGHLAPMESPGVVLAAIDRFLAGA